MTILNKFEQLAEKMFTGAFKKNAKPLQPVEIAKILTREMQRHKRVSVSAVYVPNVYKVLVSPEDWAGIGSFASAFADELSKYLLQQGQQGGYTFLSEPLVELEPGKVVAGEIETVCEFDESLIPEADNHVPDENEQQHTLIFTDKSFQPEPLQRERSYLLEAVEGTDIGKRFPLKEGSIFIGRHSECDLVLDDTKISRRHATLACRNGEFFLDDLGSTNGTFVNGRRIGRTKITPGDRVSVGNTVLELRVV